MLLNIIIIVFILGMAVMWATYGLFSAFLHLLVVIIAGALAFALWEPLVYGLLMKTMPMYAWGVGLLAPFILLLIGLRQGMDFAVRGNMQFPRLADQLVGGAFGALSGLLTAGITVIGVGYLPLTPAFAGYQAYEVGPTGQVQLRDGGALWLKVDSMAATFYNKVSAGAFKTSTPLATYLPDVDQQASVFRLARTYDENQSLTASPGTVSTVAYKVYAGDDPLPGAGGQINQWFGGTRKPGEAIASATIKVLKQDKTTTYDTDSILRLTPTQVRLNIATPDNPGQLLAPIGFSKLDPGTNQVQFYPVANNNIFASVVGYGEYDINWFFAVPDRATPRFLLVRNTRVPLPQPEAADAVEMARTVGTLPPEDDGEGATSNPADTPKISGDAMAITSEPSGYATHKAISIQQTADLPNPVSQNKFQGLKYDEEVVLSGQTSGETGGGGLRTTLRRVFVSPSLRPLRLQMVTITPDSVVTQAAQNIVEIWLSDTNGQVWRPFGYIVDRADKTQKFNILSSGEFRTNGDLDLADLRKGDKLYVYWRVPPGITIDRYNIGSANQEIGFSVK